MDRLYAPWRWEYIVNPKPTDCPFCDYLSQDPTRDAENNILLRGQNAFVVLNRFPYSNGHIMVLPNRHVSMLEDLEDGCQAELMQLTTYCTKILRRAYHPQGFNVGINLGKVAGAGMETHLHIHIVPRWEGDTNFMPVIGQTRMLPEELADTFRRLRDIIETDEPPPAFQLP